MRSKPCRQPGCSRIVDIPWCEEHRPGEQGIERAGYHVYRSKRWRILRRRKLFLDPLCERCGAIATQVHHIEGVEISTWEIEQLESLCASCHSVETRQEQLA